MFAAGAGAAAPGFAFGDGACAYVPDTGMKHAAITAAATKIDRLIVWLLCKRPPSRGDAFSTARRNGQSCRNRAGKKEFRPDRTKRGTSGGHFVATGKRGASRGS